LTHFLKKVNSALIINGHGRGVIKLIVLTAEELLCSGNELHVKTGLSGQPALLFWGLVTGMAIGDQVDVESRRRLWINAREESHCPGTCLIYAVGTL
jgi:hypothetical protein